MTILNVTPSPERLRDKMSKLKKPRKRLVKAKLKEDKLLAFTAKAQKFGRTNRKTIVFGVSGVVLVAIIASLLIYSHKTTENNSSFMELMVRDAYSRGELDQTLEYANALLEDYPNTNSAATALLLKGRVHEQRGEYDQAIEHFEELINRHSDQPYLSFAAYYALGAIHEGMNEYEAAARYYQKAANKYSTHFNAAVALLEAGESFEKASRYDEAKSAYQKVLSTYSKSRSADKARTNLAVLEFTQ